MCTIVSIRCPLTQYTIWWKHITRTAEKIRMCTIVSICCPVTQCTIWWKHITQTAEKIRMCTIVSISPNAAHWQCTIWQKHTTQTAEKIRMCTMVSIHCMPTVEPCHSLTAVCKACWWDRSQTTCRELTSAHRDSLPCPLSERGIRHQLVKQDKDIVHKTSAGKQSPVSITSSTDSSTHDLLLMRQDKGIIHRTDISM